MDGILIVNKEKGYTSRDVVNKVSKILGTKKIGHTGTLDPLATGVLVLCIGEGLKVVELLMNHDKEYIAKFKLGINTDTLDITGKVLNTCDKKITKEQLLNTLNKFQGLIKQEVPKYSAVKVNGKKLYEYARNNIEVKLPIKEVNIYKLELLNYNEKTMEVTISCIVSKGTYIRSLIRDIGSSLGTYATMTELNRTKLGIYDINDSYSLSDIENDKYKMLDIKDIYPEDKKIIINDDNLLKKIKNGMVLDKFYEGKDKMILDKNKNLIAIYTEYSNKNKVKPWKMFVNQ